MAKNGNLHAAKRAKNDEFYTMYEDVERECAHYIKHFKGQHIYMPCDTEDSNFWKYFMDHFAEYGIRHITATHIANNYRVDYDGETVKRTPIDSGDFRSAACTAIRDKCDMVITNPPFSQARNFFFWLQGGRFEQGENGDYKRVES